MCICVFFSHRNYISYMLTITAVYLLVPLLVMLDSYNTIYKYFRKTHNYKVQNSTEQSQVALLYQTSHQTT